MLGTLLLFEENLVHVVAITFTSLILTELIMVAFSIHTWHWIMIVSEIISLIIYLVSMLFLPTYFDLSFVRTWTFVWKVLVVTLVSCLPFYIAMYARRKWAPPSYSKLT
eukprot:Colp12_sorted_trinity150504_noHs@25286